MINIEILISVLGEDFLYALDTESNRCSKTDLLEKDQLANGYGCFVDIHGIKELAAIYTANKKILFFFKTSYLLEDSSLSASQKDGFFKSRFILFKNRSKVIDIKYSPIDPESDVFIDVAEWLKTKNREQLLEKLSNISDVLSEKDPIRRRELAMNKK